MNSKTLDPGNKFHKPTTIQYTIKVQNTKEKRKKKKKVNIEKINVS